MEQSRNFKNILPKYLYNNYAELKKCSLIKDNILSTESIQSFQELLNKSQPNCENDMFLKSLISYLYRRDSNSFRKYLYSSKLPHLILWTETKFIVKHFKLQGVVYIKNIGGIFQCSKHNRADKNLKERKVMYEKNNSKVERTTSFDISEKEFPTLGDSKQNTVIGILTNKSYSQILQKENEVNLTKDEDSEKKESDNEEIDG